MPVLFQKPQANINAPGFDSPAFQVNQVIDSMEIRLTKNSWPVNAQISASIEYSADQVTWTYAGGVTDDGSRTKDAYIKSFWSPPLPSGLFWRGHVTVNQTLNTGVIITATP
jgi:hypothetical protein